MGDGAQVGWVGMRWAEREPFDRRVRRGFLLFPRCINGEWRWLEMAEWRQFWGVGLRSCAWIDEDWLN